MPQEQKQDVIWEVRACLSTTFCSLDIVRVCVCVGGGVTENGIYWTLETNPENRLHMSKEDGLQL